MEKVAVSSLGKILSLKYPRDVLCCYATVCVSPKLRTQQLVSCRCQKKGSSASQEALETVQVGGSPRKSKTTESVRTQGWCCHEPLKKLTDGRLSLGWDLKMRKTGRGRSTRSTSCVSFSFAFASGLLLTLWKCHKDEHFTCGECGSGVTQRACRRVMLKSLSSYSIVIKSLSRKVTIILILCLFKKKKGSQRFCHATEQAWNPGEFFGSGLDLVPWHHVSWEVQWRVQKSWLWHQSLCSQEVNT